MKFDDIRVFICVPAVGKSYLSKHNKAFVDMDELKARYKYEQEDATEREIEWLKGNRGEAKRKHATKYIEEKTLELLKTTDKILLFAPNPSIVDMICKNQIPYCLVFHSKDCVNEIEQRMRNRGNQENFIRAMIDPIDKFYEDSTHDERPCMKIELFGGEYLLDVFNDPQKFLQRSKKYNKKELSLS